MSKIRYIIAEDDERHLEQLQKMIATVPFKDGLCFSEFSECVAVCTDGLATWTALQHYSDVQILFLDYLMPEMTGKSILELLKKQPNAPKVILVSAYADKSMDLMTFYPNIAAPILKPVTKERFKAAMEKVFLDESTIAVFYTLDGKKAVRLLRTKTIVEMEAVNKKVLFSIVNPFFKNYEKLESNSDYHTLKDLIEKLPSDDFYRINHSYIINRKHIKGISATDVEMQNGKVLGISNQGAYNRDAFFKWARI